MRAAELNLGHLTVRIEDTRRDGGHVAAHFTCPCGWTMTTRDRQLWVPEAVKRHALRCLVADDAQIRMAL